MQETKNTDQNTDRYFSIKVRKAALQEELVAYLLSFDTSDWSKQRRIGNRDLIPRLAATPDVSCWR